LEQARGRRPKYEALALLTRSSALLLRSARSSSAAESHQAAIMDLREAVAIARSVGDPALFVRAASALLAVDGNDVLATEARAAAQHILGHLPTPEMQQRFTSAEPVRALGQLVLA
jgi:hypothetical protein